ncbi:MAG: hypothetical protein QX189_16795 [Methylococcales bacterium]
MTEPESSYFKRDSIINRPFSWQSLRKFGSSRAVKTSYYWIFLIPLFAKVVHQIHPMVVNFLAVQQTLEFTLPFSWFLLYFSALSFAFSSLLYDIFCPKIISSFKNFREFLDSGCEGLFLADELVKNIPFDVLHNTSLYWLVIAEWKKINCEKEINPDTDIFSKMRYCLGEIKREDLGSIFYTFTEVVNHSHPKIMRVTGFFYYLGFLLLFIVLLQNINSVLIEMFGINFPNVFSLLN